MHPHTHPRFFPTARTGQAYTGPATLSQPIERWFFLDRLVDTVTNSLRGPNPNIPEYLDRLTTAFLAVTPRAMGESAPLPSSY